MGCFEGCIEGWPCQLKSFNTSTASAGASVLTDGVVPPRVVPRVVRKLLLLRLHLGLQLLHLLKQLAPLILHAGVAGCSVYLQA